MDENLFVKIKKHKVAIIITIAFWILSELFVVAPIAVAIVDSVVGRFF